MSAPRVSPTIAHAAPLAVFLGFTALVPMVAIENTALPWWRHAPEQWIYPIQTVVVGTLLWRWRKHYRFEPLCGFGLAVILGVVGIVWWCLPAWLFERLATSGVAAPAWWEWLGLAPRTDGFDPTLSHEHPVWHAAAVVMRFARLVLVVPLAEEIFWRGYLMRLVQADGGDFQRVPFGRPSWAAFVITTLGFMFVHHQTDWLGALGFGALMYLLAIRTKSLAACVVMHAVANLLLGIYVMVTKQWGFW
jgi:CAAX prenyl protease-like protein